MTAIDFLDDMLTYCIQTLRTPCIYGWVIWKRQRRKQTDNRTEKNERKGEELEGKGQKLLQGRGTIGCYSVVSVIVYVRRLIYQSSCVVKEWAGNLASQA